MHDTKVYPEPAITYLAMDGVSHLLDNLDNLFLKRTFRFALRPNGWR